MHSLGHIAGVGAAVVGFLSPLMSLPIGIYIGHNYNGTVLPLFLGFIAFGFSAIVLATWTEHKTDVPEK
jgi:DHA1 family bicyclomycin/chloramphenicol resistance-like MFS transporter